MTISGNKRSLGADGFAYIPQDSDHNIEATSESRIEVFEKPFIATENQPSLAAVFGKESDITSQPLMGDPDLQVRSLLPDSIAYDFAVNTMEYQPGAALAMVEMHVMEHGLLMLQGGGIYRLADSWYPVTVGDFIWMAPYCPSGLGPSASSRQSI